jgi:NAD(P)-dependent dehydrogenase (short-subunit alcohol dehydrogenase family)
MIDFTDQAVVVTGAGRGLGRLYALLDAVSEDEVSQ